MRTLNVSVRSLDRIKDGLVGFLTKCQVEPSKAVTIAEGAIALLRVFCPEHETVTFSTEAVIPDSLGELREAADDEVYFAVSWSEKPDRGLTVYLGDGEFCSARFEPWLDTLPIR